ncbi:transposase [Paenibacillus sp. J5C_2022]|uniref:transposase n=1 Tax=Paenibacillus sp. J5C2022 TaxID=2977129 RepID=UPI0021D05B1B|nr:transposase [Paenibacillus sp. J5C2022]MCU6712112.1 transposase [Paenibacillus sp. J5C2022]
MLKDAVEQFYLQFQGETSYISYIEQARWPKGFVCPACGHKAAYKIKTRSLPLYECKDCKRHTSLTANTMMHKSRTPLDKWLLAIYLVSSYEASVNAVQLSDVMKVTYKTAWSMLHKIRQCISQWDHRQLLTGNVEAKHDIYMKQLVLTPERREREQSVIIARGCRELSEEGVLLNSSNSNIRNLPYYKIKLISRATETWKALSYQEQRDFTDKYCGYPLRTLHMNPEYKAYRKYPYTESAEFWVDSFESGDDSQKFRPCGWSAAALNEKVKEQPFLFPLSVIASEAFRWMNEKFNGIGRKYAQSYIDEFCFRMNFAWGQTQNPLLSLLQMALYDSVSMTNRHQVKQCHARTGEDQDNSRFGSLLRAV